MKSQKYVELAINFLDWHLVTDKTQSFLKSQFPHVKTTTHPRGFQTLTGAAVFSKLTVLGKPKSSVDARRKRSNSHVF